MDRSEEEMKFLGFFGVFKQSFRLIFSWKKVFAQIATTLVLPLTIVFLAHLHISNRFSWRMNEDSMLKLHEYDGSNNQRRLALDHWLYYWLFTIAYFIILTVFSLLSTAAVVFTIASVYTDREVVYRNVMKVVPNVWKRLFVTFVYIYLAFVLYNVAFDVALFASRSIFKSSIVGIVLWQIIVIVSFLGFLYLSVVWQLASVVTILENSYGLKAMRKGKDLLNGKKIVGMGIAFVLYGFLEGLAIVYGLFVEFGGGVLELAVVWRVMIGILIGVMLMMLFVIMIVTQTVMYLVCKSHHREAIDKLGLSMILGACMDETVMLPKIGEEIQVGTRTPQLQPQPPCEPV